MKTYPAEIRLYARGLYLQGNSLVETARLVKEQYPDARCNAETIRRWAESENWDADKREVMEKVVERQKGDVAEILEKHRDLYGKMVEKGASALEGLDPRSASEAGNLLDAGIKGQRATLKELVSLNFARDLFQIIIEEVPDEETRRRIALRFREKAEAL